MTDLQAQVDEIRNDLAALRQELGLTPEVGILVNHGMHNAAALAAAAKATGVPLWIAAAFAQKESGGRNIYGNDTGGTFAGKGQVTEENYTEFYRLVVEEKQKSNGVGPMQITYPAYFPQAKAEGIELWEPYDNFFFGLRIVARNLKGDYTAESLQRTGTLYNAGNLTNGINAYGYDLAAKAAVWATRLGVTIPAPTPAPTPTPDPAPTPAPTPDPEPITKDKVGETIREGDVGEAVKAAQRRLTVHGFPEPRDGVPNGVFGSRMTLQVMAFQKANELTDDGVIGRNTWTALLVLTEVERFQECRTALTAMGWRCDTPARLRQAVEDFQRMYNLGPALAVDGKPGPLTMAAVRFSYARHLAGEPDISAHFSAKEFACKCGGKYPDCRRIWALRTLVRAAESYRTLAGPFSPLSACRCVEHNKAVGGYYRSQHIHGTAMDVRAVIHVDKVKALGVFPAIGKNASNDTVRHVDFRNLSSDNYPRATGSTTYPYIYNYGS